MQEQYNKIKLEYKDYIVLFRLGDFYEAFNEDAVTISKVLGITLTGRGKDESRVPMAGIPYHALPNYLPKIIENRLKVAVADQIEEATPGKLVERKITRIITPGTVTEERSIQIDKNNYLACVVIDSESGEKNRFSLSYLDINIGEIQELSGENFLELKNELEKLSPSEILVEQKSKEVVSKIFNGFFNVIEHIDLSSSKKVLSEFFEIKNLNALNIDDSEIHVYKSLGALVSYIQTIQQSRIKHIRKINRYSYKKTVQLDFQTIKNLEILFPQNGNLSLFDILNHCSNSMGKRLLRYLIVNPLKDPQEVSKRLDSVEFLFEKPVLNHQFREVLSGIIDIERILGKIGLNSVNPKEIYYLNLALQKIYNFVDSLQNELSIPELLNSLIQKLKNDRLYLELDNIVSSYLQEDPSLNFGSGNIIKKGISNELDSLLELKTNSKQILANLQKKEIEASGISSLKISFNSVFGYYIEVTKTNLDKVPSHFVRKQTLANAERFITEELKLLEEQILSADTQLLKLEISLFEELKNKISQYLEELSSIIFPLSMIDVLSNFAYVSKENSYTKPIISNKTKIVKGRHPVVEKLIQDYVSSDTDFEKRIHIVTGPNMAGKSTYIRGVSLIYLMSQIGCFVPAESFEFEIVDNIFTRIGSGDNLAKGESTFMVEMIETARILNASTDRSLIILDEVGRGTSTFDGVSIAWSILEYIYKKIRAKTLFATHYHEITQLQSIYKDQIANYQVEVREKNNQISFLYKIIPGATNKSYGIHVAKMAGVPLDIVSRAEEILESLQNESEIVDKAVLKSKIKIKKINTEQISLLENQN